MSEALMPGTGSVTAFIGLGSNLKDPESQIRNAVRNLGTIPRSRLLGMSRLYRSRPLGPQDQPDYINAVAKLETELPADRLLNELQAIEARQGRIRAEKWGARTLDLDILLYGEKRIESRRLTVPHPGIRDRSFVLWPLADVLDGAAELPGLGRLDKLIEACPADGLEHL